MDHSIEPRRYRKKPVTVLACRLPLTPTPEQLRQIAKWCKGKVVATTTFTNSRIVIPTLEGDMTAAPGDYVICGVEGEFYPCKPSVFLATYEEDRR